MGHGDDEVGREVDGDGDEDGVEDGEDEDREGLRGWRDGENLGQSGKVKRTCGRVVSLRFAAKKEVNKSRTAIGSFYQSLGSNLSNSELVGSSVSQPNPINHKTLKKTPTLWHMAMAHTDGTLHAHAAHTTHTPRSPRGIYPRNTYPYPFQYPYPRLPSYPRAVHRAQLRTHVVFCFIRTLGYMAYNGTIGYGSTQVTNLVAKHRVNTPRPSNGYDKVAGG